MRSSTFITVAAATLAAASPCKPQPAPSAVNSFNVTDFVFGCTSGCYWSFNVSVAGDSENHPAVNTPVKCKGGLDENPTYVDCGFVSDTSTISAYIIKANTTEEVNTLQLKYTANKPAENSWCQFTGSSVVYAETSTDAALQQPNFSVNETSYQCVA